MASALRQAGRGLLLGFLCACGSGGSGWPGAKEAGTADATSADDARDAGAALEDGGVVTGTVIDATQEVPLEGRTVFIGAFSTTTDASGRFAIPGAPPVYDLVVVDPDATTVSVYSGLTRRDPLVLHRRSPTDASMPASWATIAGSFSGGPSWPLGATESAGLWFVSPVTKDDIELGGMLTSNERGPRYGPIRIAWNGSGTLAGQLFSWASGGGSGVFYAASQSLTVQDGGTSMANMTLQAVAQTTHVGGTVQAPGNAPPTQESVYFALPPLPGARIPVAGGDTSAASFDYVVPLLTVTGSSLCFEAFSSTGDSNSPIISDAMCDLTPGTPVSSVLQAPPSFTSPLPSATATAATRFRWTTFAGGVYELDLESGQIPTAAAPNVYIYTAETGAAWPDLSVESIPFPAGSIYACTLVGLGVFASLDQAAGPAGIAAAIVPDLRRSYLPAIPVAFAQ